MTYSPAKQFFLRLVFWGSCCAMAVSQIPAIPEVPVSLPAADQRTLEEARTKLIEQRKELRQHIEDFNGLPPVREGSGEARERQRQQEALKSAKKIHLQSLADYQHRLGEARAAFKRAQELAKEDGAKAKKTPTTRDAALRKLVAILAAAEAETASAAAPGLREVAKQRAALSRRAIANLRAPDTKARFIHSFLAAHGREISDEADRQMAAEYGFVADPVATARVSSVLDRIRAASLFPEERLEVRIVGGTEVGCVAAASRTTVYVQAAYLRLGPTDDELAMVLGHEVAHAQLDHGSIGVLHTAMQGDLESHESIDGVVREAALLARTGLFDRELEFEADLVGTAIALAAGASLEGERALLDRLAGWEDEAKFDISQRKRAGDRTANDSAAEMRYELLIASHPSAAERRKALEEAVGQPLKR